MGDFSWFFWPRWITFNFEEWWPVGGRIECTESSYDDCVVLFKLSSKINLILPIDVKRAALMLFTLVFDIMDLPVTVFGLKILIAVH